MILFGIKLLLFLSSCVQLLMLQNDDSKSSSKNRPDKKLAITIGAATTNITRPLDNAGYVDYQKAMNVGQLDSVKPSDNFALVLWQVLDSNSVEEIDRQAFFGQMSMDNGTKTNMVPIVDSKTFFASHKYILARAAGKTQKFLDGPLKPWTRKDAPAVAAFLSKNEKQLGVLADGIMRPRFAQPYVCNEPPKAMGSMLYGILELKQIARMFASRSMLNLGNGELEKAHGDAEACQRIGYFLQCRATDFEVKLGFEIYGWAAEAERVLLAQASFTQEQTKAHFEALLNSPPDRNLVDVFGKTGRWLLLDFAQFNARWAGKPNAPREAWIRSALVASSIDFDKSLQVINQWFDRGVMALSRKTPKEVTTEIQLIYRDLDEMQKGMVPKPGKVPPDVGIHLGKMIVTQMYPDLQGLYTSSIQTKTNYRIILAGNAARLFQIENGRFPESLDELVGTIIKDKNHILDPITGKPFQIQVEKGDLIISGSEETESNGLGSVKQSELRVVPIQTPEKHKP